MVIIFKIKELKKFVFTKSNKPTAGSVHFTHH